MNTRSLRVLLTASTAFVALSASQAWAQDAKPAPARPDADTFQIEEVVVTALKQSVSMQETPATISVVTSQQLQSAGISSIEQLGSVVPGVIIQRPPNNTANATIRGVGTAPGPVAFDQAVALFVDGVYAPRGADFLSALFDVDRVEVVKGTQAAVLGKNTSLGAVALTTRKPGRVFAFDALADYEFERNSKIVSGGVDIPLSSTFAIRIAGQYQDLGGFMKNRFQSPTAEKDARQTREHAGRITGVWRPNDDVTGTLSYSHEKLRSTGVPSEFIVSSPAAVLAFTAAGHPELLETDIDFHYASGSANGPSRLNQTSDRATGQLDYDLGPVTLTSISAWSRFRQGRYIDYDYTPGNYFDDRASIKGSQLSQELRLSSDHAKPFHYILGGLYVHNELFQDLFQSVHYPINPQGAFEGTFAQTTKTWSLFAQPTYDFTDQWSIVGGVRVTGEKKAVDMERVRLVAGSYTTVQYPPFPMTHLSRSETVADGSVTLQYKPKTGLMLYTSYGQGTKGGGFSDFSLPANAPYRKEVARTGEAGFKLEGEGHVWHVNGAVFHTKVDDFQNNLFNGANFVVQNIDLTSKGVEFDGLLQATRSLRLTVEGTYADTRNLNQTPGKDDRLPRSPKLSGKIAALYNTDLGERYVFNAGADLTYRSKISHQLDATSVPFGKAFPAWNGIIGLRDRETGVELSLIGRNLTNAKSLSFAFAAPNLPGAAIGTPEEARTIMLQLKINR